MSSYDDQVEEIIPGTIYMFAGAEDTQQAFGISNVDTFELPDPAGRSGGACTSAFLQALWRDDADGNEAQFTWADTLAMMRDKIEEIGLTQVPQLSTSKPIDINEEICITAPPEYDEEYDEYVAGNGTKRAMLVGINYTGEDNALTSCHNDVRNMKDFLVSVHGFERQNMLILMDDDNHHEPTKQLIMDGFRRLCQISQPGDSIFIQFSGHGGRIADRNGDEKDKMDEALIPGDYKKSGHILDDELYAQFVTQVPAGVHVVCIIDCCHSGSAMDLPYICDVGDEQLRYKEGFNLIRPTAATATTKNGGKKPVKKKVKGKKEKDKDSEADKDVKKDGKKGTKKKGEKKKSTDKEDKEKKPPAEKGKKKKVSKKKSDTNEEDEDDDDQEGNVAAAEGVDDNDGKEKKKKVGLFGGLLGKGKKKKT